MVKKILNSLKYFFIIILLGIIFITLFNYFNIFNSKIISILKFILVISAIIFSSYKLGNSCDKLGYIEGLKLGSIIVLIFIILTLILDSFRYRSILYYVILLLFSIMGSMIGINRKK